MKMEKQVLVKTSEMRSWPDGPLLFLFRVVLEYL
jgi:hypothetical protein